MLEVHVMGLSRGEGESIVVKLPNGSWGVIDSFTDTPGNSDRNLAIDFLRRKGVRSLAFACLTHLHADHLNGFADILDTFSVDEFWRFDGLTPSDFTYAIMEIEHATGGREFQRVITRFQEKFGRDGKRAKNVALNQELLWEPAAPGGSLAVRGLGPSPRQINGFQKSLRRLFDEDHKLIPEARRDFNHNTSSAALLIEYGTTAVVLGGDMLEEGWKDAREGFLRNLAADAVKASHHGSPNGYCNGLWEQFAAARTPICVITPYRRHRLPAQEALDHIRPFVREFQFTTGIRGRGSVSGPWTIRVGSKMKRDLGLWRTFKARPVPVDKSHYGVVSLIFDPNAGLVETTTSPYTFER